MVGTSEIVERLSALPKYAISGSALAAKASDLDTRVMLVSGEQRVLICIEQGVVRSVSPGPHVMPSVDFSLRASEVDWQLFLASVPPPGSHDLIALLRRGALQLQGNLHPVTTAVRRLILGNLPRSSAMTWSKWRTSGSFR